MPDVPEMTTSPPTTTVTSAPAHRRRQFARAAAIMGVAGIAGAAALLERRRHQRRAPHARALAPLQTPGLSPRRPGSPRDILTLPLQTEPKPQPGQSDQQPLWQFLLITFGLLVVLSLVVGADLLFRGVRRFPPGSNWHVPGGDPARGRAAFVAQGCGACHLLDDLPSATGRVGPPLDGFAHRMYIGGQLPNTPQNLVAWLQDPRRYAPGTAMPNLPIPEPAARDLAAYLYSNP